MIARFATNYKNVLVQGEAGTGKSTVAACIAAADLSTVVINPVVGDEKELEQILASVNSRTIIIENIDEAAFRSQEVILKFVDNQANDRQLIFTLKADPKQLFENGKILDGICRKLTGFDRIQIHPLRERPEDIPLFVKHFANGLVIDINALGTLVQRAWLENIRELKAVIDRCIASSTDGKLMLPQDFVEERTELAKMINGIIEHHESVLDKSLDSLEVGILERALKRFGFDESKAAQFLGMSDELFGKKLKLLKAGNSTTT